MTPEPLPGYVWLDTPGKALHAEERHLEFTDDPPEGGLVPRKIHRRRDADPKSPTAPSSTSA
jgi:hypothetical protein